MTSQPEGAAIRTLSVEDVEWLKLLTPADLSGDWLAQAQDMVTQGASVSFQDYLPVETGAARNQFYGEHLGLNDSTALLHRTHARFAARRATLAPTNTFVDAMRAVHGLGVNVFRVSRTYMEAWTYTGSTICKKTASIAEALEESEAAKRVIEANARVLKYSEYAQKIHWLLGMATDLHWPDHEARRLPEIRPLAIAAASSRLELQAAYFGWHGIVEHTAAEIGGLLLEHPNNHLIALRSGVPDYTYANVRRLTAHLNTAEKGLVVREILHDQGAKNQFGSELLAAHEAFLAGPQAA